MGACVPLAAMVDELDDSASLILKQPVSIQREITNLSGGVSYVPVAWHLYPEILNSSC